MPRMIAAFRTRAIRACEQRALQIARELNPRRLANIGSGRNERWWGAECVDADMGAPASRRLRDAPLDFNTDLLPFACARFDLVVCEQVIEHLHNTTHFLNELHRILEPGGTLLLSTENLASLPNLLALACGRAPFSTQPVCGEYVGGFRDRPAGYTGHMSPAHPLYSGTHGHVRVMPARQLRLLCHRAGFKLIAAHGYGFNHYILLRLVK